ncbi:MAG: hypothetical protein ACRD2A_19075, partial [Vicinamibacterales bacterium]
LFERWNAAYVRHLPANAREGDSMSDQAVVGPLKVERQHAAIVGALIATRSARRNLDHTPFASLRDLADKLLAGAKRKRTSTTQITLWTVGRPEALAGFNYLALFSRPEAEGFLTEVETDAVHAVTLTLAMALVARRGGSRLDREAIDQRLKNWLEAPDERVPIVGDERWVRRLRRRAADDDALQRTLAHSIPASVLELLVP